MKHYFSTCAYSHGFATTIARSIRKIYNVRTSDSSTWNDYTVLLRSTILLYYFQLAQLDHYESRLAAMAYMGNFDELLNSTQPVRPE